MLKGVSRQIVEIAQPESRYFEKIILFVKPEFSGLPEARLAAQAEACLPEEALPPKRGKKRRAALRWGGVARAAACAGAGAGILALLEMLVK